MSNSSNKKTDDAPRSKAALSIQSAITAAFTVFVIGIVAYVWLANRPAFVMVVTAGTKATTVKFVQPRGFDNPRMVSPDFLVEAAVAQSIELDIRDVEKSLPGAKIEFSDTTILPGRIRIRYCGRTFDVMSSRIIVDGVDQSWLQDGGK